MGNWVVCENSRQDSYREFDVFYLIDGSGSGRKVLRLWPDGGIEIGTCNSPFIAEWSTRITTVSGSQVSQQLSRIKSAMAGI
jgi:hypothetical protein